MIRNRRAYQATIERNQQAAIDYARRYREARQADHTWIATCELCFRPRLLSTIPEQYQHHTAWGAYYMCRHCAWAQAHLPANMRIRPW